MIGQIIQSYLVSLGVQVDKPGFQQADQTIKQTGENVERITGGMARNFVKASTIIGSAIASVTASAVGLMKAAAQEDLAMQKYARSMMMSEDAAWRMKKATDALGESINDIALTPELLGRFTQLTADGSKMKVGGDFKQTMKDFRDLMFEFTRLKQEASYALNWVGYYLMKYLQKPLADIREKFKAFNDSVIKNMSVLTEKVARAIYYVIEVGRHLIEFLGDIGKAVYKLWDSFPSGVKKAIAAIGLLTAVLKASPFSRAIMLISTLLLLIDDYYGYMEGKNAAFGKYWDKLNEYLEKGKTLWEQLKTKAEPYWNMLVEYAGKAKTWFDELVEGAGRLKKSFDEWMDSTGNELLADVVEECQSLWGILTDIGNTIKDTLLDAWKGLWEQLEKNGTLDDLRKNFERVGRIVKMVYQAGKDLINFFLRLWRELEKSEEVREFGAAIMELYDAVVELLGAIMEVVETALRAFFGEFNKTNKVTAFRDVLRSVAKALAIMARGISSVIRWLTKLFQKVANNKTFISFWKHVADAIDTVVKKCGKLGRAFGALLDGDPKKAWKILQSLGDDEGKEAGAGNTDWNKRVVYERLKAAGYNDEAIAGIMGRVQQEHNFDTSDVPEHWETLENGERVWVGGLGMFQWNGSRKDDFKKWAQENGLNYLDPGVQTDYAIIEAKQRGLDPDELNKENVAGAASRWTKEWEVGRPGNELKYATQIYGEIKHGNGNTWMTALPTAGGSSLAGDAAAENAMSYKEGTQWVGGATDDLTIQCDSFTANVYSESGIPSIGGHSTDNTQGHVINDLAFKDAGAWHEGDGYQPKNGDLIGWNWSETSGHYGIYDADSDTVVTRDSRGGITHRTLQEAIEQWGEPTGYGSIAEAEAQRKSSIQQTAYTTEKANVVPLGTQMPAMAMPERTPHKYDDAPRPDQLDGYEDSRLKKLPTPQQPSIRQVAKEAGESVQRVKETVREKVVQPMIAVQEKAHISEVKTETTAYLNRITFLLVDIKKAIQSLGHITITQTGSNEGTPYEIVYPEAKEKPKGENLAGILQQILAATQGIKKDLPEEVNLEKVMEPLQNAFPTEVVAELQQAAENLQREIPMEGLEQVGDKIAGEVAKAMPVGDFEAIEGFLKNAGFEGFGKHIQDLGKIGRAATEPLLQAQAPVYVSPTIDGGKQPANVNVKVDLGGITVNGVKDPQAAANVVFKNAEKEFSLAYGRLLSNNHGLQV